MTISTNKSSLATKAVSLTCKFIRSRNLCYITDTQNPYNKHLIAKDLVGLTKWISDYSMRGQIDIARKLFDEMPHRDSVAWNVIIKCLIDNDRIIEAREMFDEMPERTTVSWNSMIMCYTQERKMHIALKLFFSMPDKDVISWTTVVSGLAQNHRIADAYQLFKEMPEQNSVSWSSIISGFQQNGLPVQALSLFIEMLSGGIRPTSHSFTSALAASAELSVLFVGQQLYSQLIKEGFESNTRLGNSAITMFMKSGSLYDARRVFIDMQRPDIVTWNSMIVGYGQHGYGLEAIMVFHQMQKALFRPDDISLLGVLQGCTHTGFVEEAMLYFRSMETDWGISPGPEHYACMVDVYSRAGLVKEAFKMISKMPFEPTTVFWRILLNGCRIWRHIELGLFAADQVLKLEPYNASACLTVIDMYKSVGRLAEVADIRRRMREREARKELAYSWIQVNSRIHLFTTEDRTHLESDSIYMILKSFSYDVGY